MRVAYSLEMKLPTKAGGWRWKLDRFYRTVRMAQGVAKALPCQTRIRKWRLA